MKKILVFGGSGLIGSRFIELNKQFEFVAPDLYEVDLLDDNQVKKTISGFDGDAVVNFAAFTNVDGAEEEKDKKDGIVYKLNALAAKTIAESCKENNKSLVHISTEYVFDGEKSDSPYTEEDKPNPVSWYGATKYYGEQFVLESGAKVLMLRLSMPFSAHYKEKMDIGRTFLKMLKNNQEIRAINDQKVTPVFVDDIAMGLRQIIENEALGIWHVVCKDFTSPFDFAKTIAREFLLDEDLVKATSFEEYSKNARAKRLKNSWLSTKKFEERFGSDKLHTVDEAVLLFKSQNPDGVD